jgi:hypothetical protein
MGSHVANTWSAAIPLWGRLGCLAQMSQPLWPVYQRDPREGYTD